MTGPAGWARPERLLAPAPPARGGASPPRSGAAPRRARRWGGTRPQRAGKPGAAVRLRDAGDAVLAGIVDVHARTRFDGEPPALRKIGVAHAVLRAGARRRAELRGPPFAPAPLRGGRSIREPACRQGRGKFGAEGADPHLQAVVEHPAHHHHAATEPLAHPPP